jgi:hypothetical protein
MMEERLKRVDEAKRNFRTTKQILAQEQDALNDVRRMSFEDWKRRNAQMQLEFAD